VPSYPCRHPTCTEYVARRGDYCATHAAEGRAERRAGARAYDLHQRDGAAKAFYNTAAWQRARATKLANDPVCQRCNKVFAWHVHHTIPIATPEGWERRLDQRILKSLCQPCHNEEEAETRGQSPDDVREPVP
jgi:5-methylcytosine-specific restriction protein A